MIFKIIIKSNSVPFYLYSAFNITKIKVELLLLISFLPALAALWMATLQDAGMPAVPAVAIRPDHVSSKRQGQHQLPHTRRWRSLGAAR